MKKIITDERTGLHYELSGTTTLSPGRTNWSKNKSQSEYGDSSTSAISRSIIVCGTPTC